MHKHTSADQVSEVAQAAGVGTLVLSHLVPSDAPAQAWARAARGFDGRLVIGTDLMEIRLD